MWCGSLHAISGPDYGMLTVVLSDRLNPVDGWHRPPRTIPVPGCLRTFESGDGYPADARRGVGGRRGAADKDASK